MTNSLLGRIRTPMLICTIRGALTSDSLIGMAGLCLRPWKIVKKAKKCQRSNPLWSPKETHGFFVVVEVACTCTETSFRQNGWLG